MLILETCLPAYQILIISLLIAVYLLRSDKKLPNMLLMIADIQTHLDSTCLKQLVLWKQSLCKRDENPCKPKKKKRQCSVISRNTQSNTNAKHAKTVEKPQALYVSIPLSFRNGSCSSRMVWQEDTRHQSLPNNKVTCCLEHITYFLSFSVQDKHLLMT